MRLVEISKTAIQRHRTNQKAFKHIMNGGLEGKEINGCLIGSIERIPDPGFKVIYNFTYPDPNVIFFGEFSYTIIAPNDQFNAFVNTLFWQHADSMNRVATTHNLVGHRSGERVYGQDKHWYTTLEEMVDQMNAVIAKVPSTHFDR